MFHLEIEYCIVDIEQTASNWGLLAENSVLLRSAAASCAKTLEPLT